MRALLIGALLQWAFYPGILVFCLSILSQAATLSISGSATGNGSQVLQVAGDNLTAWWNGTAWHIEGAM